MIAVLDCGTTNSRLSIVDRNKKVVARGHKKIGVSDTSRTGSRKALREGIEALFYEVLRENHIPEQEIELIVSSGMITSEIGLMEIPHIKAPAGKYDLAKKIVRCEPEEKVLDLPVPVLFIPGIRNDYPDNATPKDLRRIDFMRGEEVQAVAIAERYADALPFYFVVLSSHTKIVYIGAGGEIQFSLTSLSGQVFDAVVNYTSIGKSFRASQDEVPSGLTEDEIISTAVDVVDHVGLLRSGLMPRFMDVLLHTTAQERNLFFEAAIAADDMRMFREIREMGYHSKTYVLYGQEGRCRLYEKLLKENCGRDIRVICLSDPELVQDLTVEGNFYVCGCAEKQGQ